jgi:hypothetical protein
VPERGRIPIRDARLARVDKSRVTGPKSRDSPARRDELGLVEEPLPGAVGLSTTYLGASTGSVSWRYGGQGDVSADQSQAQGVGQGSDFRRAECTVCEIVREFDLY